MFNITISYIAAAVAAGIALLALWREPRSFIHRIFAAGMILCSVNAALTGVLFQSLSIDNFLIRQQFQSITASFLPSVWLLFSISFARANYMEQISKWKWVIISFFILPVLIAIFFRDSFFSGEPVLTKTSELFIAIGRSGYIWHLIWILSAILILMNFEKTFRHATGHIRWQTKFMFLGLGAIIGIRLFTYSYVLLFKGVTTGLYVINQGALLVAAILILRSLLRGKPLNASIQLSHQLLYNSFTMLIAGIYFILVGALTWLSVHFAWLDNTYLIIFFAFTALLIILSLLLSDRLRVKRKRFISRHFKRPQYDYRKIWGDFTNRTASVTQTKDLCSIIVNMVSETMEILSVSIWIVDDKQERMSLEGSTVFTDAKADSMSFSGYNIADLTRTMEEQSVLLDLKGNTAGWVKSLNRIYDAETRESRIRYCVPLNAAGQLIGIMTLSEKVFYEPLSFEETELVRTIGDQAAAILQNLRLSEHLRKVKELEAFQAMSAFFMHDLKNLATKLSLVTQNLPVLIDNPEFRADALKTISQSVLKINSMSSRLSLLSQKLELYVQKTDLNEMITSAVSDIKGYTQASVLQNLNNVPLVFIDPEQINKVLENLLMNACDAIEQDGKIIVETASQENWVQISIYDNGCGMSEEFIANDLFRPFRTTKKQGMGIGLFHCKTIVEAHGGRIEVESKENKWSMFRVFLPISSK
ncbi:MAG: PEP-CTERM system histidine kinase PrsK [Proteobacteria bacterium]|nr:PEP-CTERM system histidine kinase PrsK [Pseudomonadota bacterium]